MDIDPVTTEPAPLLPQTGSLSIAVFAKAPIPGSAKTRLIPTIGAVGAARLQRELTRRALCVARQAGIGPVHLWCAPDIDHPWFRALRRRAGVACHRQHGADLGQRMLHAFEHHAASGPLLLIGTDCPSLTPGHLHKAAAALACGHDAVFLPAEDGGYVLVGLRRPIATLFRDIDWSTARVMTQTRERLRAVGARWQEPATLWDIDRPEDLARWRAHPAGQRGRPDARLSRAGS